MACNCNKPKRPEAPRPEAPKPIPGPRPDQFAASITPFTAKTSDGRVRVYGSELERDAAIARADRF